MTTRPCSWRKRRLWLRCHAGAWALPLLVSACATGGVVEIPAEVVEISEQSVARLYNKALDALYDEDYQRSASLFEDVEREYPYSWWATRAQLMAAFAYYSVNAYDDAVIASDRFLNLHPGSGDAPYAHYLKGMSYYEQVRDVARDQKNTELALLTFRRLAARYPGTPYARDAGAKVNLLIDNLAGKEMEIGRFYQARGEYLAALNRFNTVVQDYETTVHAVEALYRLVESYLSLGLLEEARRAAAVLGHNYADSAWYRDAYRLLNDNGLTQASDATGDLRSLSRALEEEAGGGREQLLAIWERILGGEGSGVAGEGEAAPRLQ